MTKPEEFHCLQSVTARACPLTHIPQRDEIH